MTADTPAAIEAGLAAWSEHARRANPMQRVASSSGTEYGLVAAIVTAAAEHIRAAQREDDARLCEQQKQIRSSSWYAGLIRHGGTP